MADPFSFAIATVAQIGISYLFPSEGPRLKDLKMSASTYGAAIPWVFGLTRVPGNMIWSLPIKEHKSLKGGGKGGSYNNYTYSCTFAMGLCHGPVKAVRRVWADGKLLHDITTSDAAANTANAKYRMRFYTGSEDQLPDSAIELDRGVGSTPAYRGLAYILFDDFNLSDFGNRVPQITAEVYVGATSEAVTVTALVQPDGFTPIDTGYASGEVAFDWTRNYGYLRYGDNISQIDLRAATEIVEFTPSNFALPGGLPPTKLLCSGQDSSVYVAFSASSSIARLEAYSMQSVATATATGGAAPICAATAPNSNATEYLMTVAADGNIASFLSSDLTPQFVTYLGGSPTTGPFRICGRDADTSGDATFYVLRGLGGADVLYLTKINGSTQSTVLTLGGSTGHSLSPGAVMWENSSASVIMFWSDGSQAYISKWSEDAGEEVWRTAIDGFPATMSSQARLLLSKLAWVYSGKLYIIDTATGVFDDAIIDPDTGDANDTVGEIDWLDYLDRYPAVRAQFSIDGYLVASDEQAYAQWDYYQGGGQGAGRTLTYIGSDQGQGFALTGDYTGDSSGMQIYDSTRNIVVCFSGIEGLVQISISVDNVTVGSIVSRMLTEGGLPSSRTDLTAIYAMPVRGYGWASGTDIKNILDELRRLFLFDLVEREGVLVAVARSEPDNGLDAAVETIVQGALGSTSAEAVDFWQETRLQESDLPTSVNLTYMNIDQDFETSTARSQRITNPIPTVYSRQQLAMEINVVMTASEAKAQANKILYSQWGERTRYNTRLPWAYLNLDPADRINVQMDDGRLYNVKLDSTEIGADFTIAVESYSQDSGAYDGWDSLTADGGGSGRTQSVPPPAVAVPFVLNTPLIRDQDDTGGSYSVYYSAIGNGTSGDFQGGGLFRSTDGLNYAALGSASGTSDVEWGTTIGTVPDAAYGPFALDWQTQITIVPAVSWFELTSITDDQLWAGGNPCVIGDEVLQFRDCVENDDGTWTIWNLLRGRRGTEYACARHSAGDRFVFLSNTTVSLQGDLTTARGQARFFKAVGQGRSIQEVPALQIAYEPRDLMPYAPADIRRDRDTGTDITISWERRTRLGGNMQDGTGEVALAETAEQYEAYILDSAFSGDPSRGTQPTNYRRMYSLTVPSFTYSAAEQTADSFTSSTDTLYVAIYQLSGVVGRGFPATRSIDASDHF